jgi:coenzyme PQQ precursor peptide PqqA
LGVAAPPRGLDYWSEDIAHSGFGRFWMTWSKPKLVELCVGLEINAYYPAEL